MSAQDKRLLLLEASKRQGSARKLKSELNLATSVRKVQQVLSGGENLQYQKISAAPAIEECCRRQRIKWATDHLLYRQ